MPKEDLQVFYDCDGALLWVFVFGEEKLKEQWVIDTVVGDTGLTERELKRDYLWPPSIENWHIKNDPEMQNPDFDEFWVRCEPNEIGARIVTGHKFQ